MKKFYIFSVQFFLICSSISAIQPRILVLPLDEQTGINQYGVIARSVEDTLSLTLKLTGQYEILKPQAYEALPSPLEMKDFTQQNSIDHILYGNLILEDGKINFVLKLYDRKTDTVSAEVNKTADEILSVFEVTDELITELLGLFSDTHIGFASLNLINEGLPGHYEIFMNDIPIGQDIRSLDKILNGTYSIEIRQARFGELKTIYKTRKELLEGETYTIPFSIPDLSASESDFLDKQFTALELSAGDKSQKESAEILIGQLNNYLSELEPTQSVQKNLLRLSGQKVMWELKKDWWYLEENLLESDISGLASTMSYPGSSIQTADMEEQALRNVRLFCTLLALQASLDFESFEWDKGVRAYNRIMETASSFGSEGGFGYADEFVAIQKALEKKRNRQKRNEIRLILENRHKTAKDIESVEGDHNLLVLSDFYENKIRINGKNKDLPYLKEDFKQDTFTVNPVFAGTEPVEIPVLGINTLYFVTDTKNETGSFNPDYKNQDYRKWHMVLGYGGGAHMAGRIQRRFHSGRFGLQTGAEFTEWYFYYYNYIETDNYMETGNSGKIKIISIPLEFDYYYLRMKHLNLYAGLLADIVTLRFQTPANSWTPELINPIGMNLGITIPIWKFGLYLDNRFYLGDEIGRFIGRTVVYAPQIGIKL